MSKILTASNIQKSYGGVRALRGAHLSLLAGEIHALMGENGAGKSTLGKIIAGAVRADEGEISVNGERVVIASPLDAQRFGISMIHQELDLFPNLSIAENIAVGNREFGEGPFVQFQAIEQRAAGFLRDVGLSVSPARRVGSLSIGEMQLVAIARAISMRARIIIMDEPTSSLFHDSVERLFELIKKLSATGVSIVYVSHKMDEILRLCDRVTVMRDGATVGTRLARETSAEELIGMMVGRPWIAGERETRARSGRVLLSVRGLTTAKLRDVSFDLEEGEVLGIAGLVGAGRSELGAALSGLEQWQGGTMNVAGESLRPVSVSHAAKHGIRVLPEDRKLDGLMMSMSVLENGTIADLPSLAPKGLLKPKREEGALRPILRSVALRARLALPVNSLSGGNQQKALLARCLLSDPRILFLDDPTRGVDVGAKEDVYAVISELAKKGKGILFVSSELPELLRCCDRVVVMRDGGIVASLLAGSTTQEEIMACATGEHSGMAGAQWLN